MTYGLRTVAVSFTIWALASILLTAPTNSHHLPTTKPNTQPPASLPSLQAATPTVVPPSTVFLPLIQRDRNFLTLIDVLYADDSDVSGLRGARHVVVSADGRHVYVAAQGGTIAVFRRDATSGRLSFAEVYTNGEGGFDSLAWASEVSLSPDDAHVYVASYLSNAVSVFQRDPVTGRLSLLEVQQDGVNGVEGLEGVMSVTVSPDGAYVYAASFLENALAVFSRNPESGRLAFAEVQRDAIGGVDGIAGAFSVTVSPDNDHIYVAGDVADALAVFRRDRMTGALSFVEAHKDGVGDIDSLDGAKSVAVSPDGRHVYVASNYDDAIVVFRRDPTTGTLTWTDEEQDGVNRVDGLYGASAVAVSPDNRYVYVASNFDDAVTAFRRDAVTGALSFIETRKNDTSGVSGLDFATSVAASPDGRHLYAAGRDSGALTTFGIQPDAIPSAPTMRARDAHETNR